MPRPPYEPASWHSLSRLTFWLSICNTGLPLPRGSKIKGLLSIRHECLTGSVLTCPASVVTFSRGIVICRSIIHLFCSGQCRICVASHRNNSSSGHDWPAGAVGAVHPVGAILPTAFAAAPSRSHGRLRRSEGPCRHNMSQILVISEVVLGDTKI